jgi:hypothetical protein
LAKVPNANGGNCVILQQAVTTACHHCVEPVAWVARLAGRDPLTGIVRHLGRASVAPTVLKCPAMCSAAKRGIIRKCDRLARR